MFYLRKKDENIMDEYANSYISKTCAQSYGTPLLFQNLLSKTEAIQGKLNLNFLSENSLRMFSKVIFICNFATPRD